MRIGNGAAFHQQFDIYGELMDGIYLYNKYGKPVTWEQWVSVREILGMANNSNSRNAMTNCQCRLRSYDLERYGHFLADIS